VPGEGDEVVGARHGLVCHRERLEVRKSPDAAVGGGAGLAVQRREVVWQRGEHGGPAVPADLDRDPLPDGGVRQRVGALSQHGRGVGVRVDVDEAGGRRPRRSRRPSRSPPQGPRGQQGQRVPGHRDVCGTQRGARPVRDGAAAQHQIEAHDGIRRSHMHPPR
jgi:hypothetical protein